MGRVRMTELVILITLICVTTKSALSDELPVEWPESEKQQVVAGCSHAILSLAFRDYLIRQGVAADQIPDNPFDVVPEDRREQTLAQLRDPANPYIRQVSTLCECIINIVSSETSFADFVASPDLVESKFNEAMESGRCEETLGPLP